MKMHVDTTLIDAARHILSVLRDHNAEAERERRLSKPVLDALTQAGLLCMLTPRSLGGLEVNPWPAPASSKKWPGPTAPQGGHWSTL